MEMPAFTQDKFPGARLAAWLLLGLFCGQPAAFAVSTECEVAFRKLYDGANGEPPAVRAAAQGTSQDRHDVLEAAKKALPKEELKKFEDFYYSQFFFGRDELVQFRAAGGQASDAAYPTIYDVNGQYPFEYYLTARQKLFSKEASKLGAADAMESNRLMLSASSAKPEHKPGFWNIFRKPVNSEGTFEEDLGNIRDSRVYDHGLQGSGGKRWIRKAEVGEPGGAYSDKDFANNPLIQRTRLSMGGSEVVEYTPLSKWRLYQNDLSKETKAALLGLETNRIDLDSESASVAAIRKKVVTELLESNYSRTHEALARAKNADEKIDAIANFYHRFVTIHPFLNGNGRVARLHVERLLEAEGLPPPLWTRFGEDVGLPKEEMRQVLRDSVQLSQQFHKDLQALLKDGFDYRLTPTSYMSTHALRGLWKSAAERIDPEEYMTWLKYNHQKMIEGSGDSWSSSSDAIHRYIRFVDNFEYQGDGVKGGIRLATPSFQRVFGELSSTEDAYNFKLRNFYSQDKIHRGLVTQERFSDAEIVANFAKQTRESTGGVGPPPPDLIKTAFNGFNRNMIEDNGAVLFIVRKRLYGESFEDTGLTTFSTKAKVSEGYSLGYLSAPAYLAEAKSRVRFESLKRNVASVDVRRSTHVMRGLQFFDHDLYNSDQGEFLLAGGPDPEAITKMIVDDIEVLPGVTEKVGIGERPLNSNEFTTQRTRTAERVSFDTVKLTETDSRGKTVSVTQWKIRPDGSVAKAEANQR